MPEANDLELRSIGSKDLEALVQQMSDREAQHMAAFVAPSWAEPQGILEHWNRLLANPDITSRGIWVDGSLAGHLASWVQEGEREVTYWIDRSSWGRGIATQSLRLFLQEIAERPLFARCAADNAGSIRVLQKCGFQHIASERSFAPARGAEVEEWVFRLDS